MKQVVKLVVGVIVGRRLLMAYIDPNSGGMIFQALAVGLGLLSGFLLFFSGQIRSFWARVRRHQRETGESGIDVSIEDSGEQDIATDSRSTDEDMGSLD